MTSFFFFALPFLYIINYIQKKKSKDKTSKEDYSTLQQLLSINLHQKENIKKIIIME